MHSVHSTLFRMDLLFNFTTNIKLLLFDLDNNNNYVTLLLVRDSTTVLPVKIDSDVMFCLQSYQEL